LKKKLSNEEECILVDLVLESADWGLPFNQSVVDATANSIIKGHDRESYMPVGDGWVSWFLDQHHDESQAHLSCPLDTQRAQALNPEVVQKWFKLVKERVALAGIRPQDIYGMDESGFPPSDPGIQHVLGRRETKTQHKQGSAN